MSVDPFHQRRQGGTKTAMPELQGHRFHTCGSIGLVATIANRTLAAIVDSGTSRSSPATDQASDLRPARDVCGVHSALSLVVQSHNHQAEWCSAEFGTSNATQSAFA